MLKIPGHKPVCDPHSCAVVGPVYWMVVCVTLHLSSTVQEPFIQEPFVQDAIKVQVVYAYLYSKQFAFPFASSIIVVNSRFLC